MRLKIRAAYAYNFYLQGHCEVSATSFYAVTPGDIPVPHGRERFYVIAILKSFPPDPSCLFVMEKANSNNECYAFDLMIDAAWLV
jgi:hypothetical protein